MVDYQVLPDITFSTYSFFDITFSVRLIPTDFNRQTYIYKIELKIGSVLFNVYLDISGKFARRENQNKQMELAN